MEKILEIKDLQVVRNGVIVLDGISLDLEAGLSLAIIGPNGGGKTTLVKVILGLLQPHAGMVRVFGLAPEEVIRRMPGAVGYVPQWTGYDPDFPVSALDVVLMGRFGSIGMLRPVKRIHREEAMARLKMVGIADLAAKPVGHLSGGQKQRVLIARSLINDPGLLILDEPTSGVDAGTQEQFYLLLRDLQQRLHISIVHISHDISMVPASSDRVACLNRRLFMHGKPEDVLCSQVLHDAYGCNIDFLFHGGLPHRVVEEHHD